MQDEFLTSIVVDPSTRKFFLYSNEGDEKVVDCQTVDEFMSVLEFVRDTAPEEVLSYASPLWPKMGFYSKNRRKKIPQNFYPVGFYKEILECYEYETRNPSIYGNVIRSEMEFTQSSEERRSYKQGDENHL